MQIIFFFKCSSLILEGKPKKILFFFFTFKYLVKGRSWIRLYKIIVNVDSINLFKYKLPASLRLWSNVFPEYSLFIHEQKMTRYLVIILIKRLITHFSLLILWLRMKNIYLELGNIMIGGIVFIYGFASMNAKRRFQKFPHPILKNIEILNVILQQCL